MFLYKGYWQRRQSKVRLERARLGGDIWRSERRLVKLQRCRASLDSMEAHYNALSGKELSPLADLVWEMRKSFFPIQKLCFDQLISVEEWWLKDRTQRWQSHDKNGQEI